jgi:uncharacterized membrane protein YeaQ/YmgE (transglycosylase-associated protein family)
LIEGLKNHQSARGEDMNLIITLIIGGIVGWLASLVMKTDAQMGMIANIVVGIVGSFLGMFLAGLIGIAPGNSIARFGVSLAGAALLIFILRALGIFGKKA